jgi:hypothetical protein
MPYIRKELRDIVDYRIKSLVEIIPSDPSGVDGIVNYVVTRIIDEIYGGGGYAVYNRAMGVLDCIAKEFYRRKVAPYEDKKIEENGDVYQ